MTQNFCFLLRLGINEEYCVVICLDQFYIFSFFFPSLKCYLIGRQARQVCL